MAEAIIPEPINPTESSCFSHMSDVEHQISDVQYSLLLLLRGFGRSTSLPTLQRRSPVKTIYVSPNPSSFRESGIQKSLSIFITKKLDGP